MTIFNYTVNYADVGVVLIVLAAAAIGYWRGIAQTLVRFIRAALGLTLCFYCSSYYTQPVYESLVRPRLLDTINEKIVLSGNLDEIIQNLNTYVDSLPKFISGQLNVKSLDITSEDIAQSILTNVFEPVALIAVKVAIFLAVFIVFFLATGIIIAAVRHHNKKRADERGHESALKKTDRLCGMLFGVLKSFVLLFALVSVFTYMMSVNEALEEKNLFFRELQNSTLIKFISSINPFNAITEGLL